MTNKKAVCGDALFVPPEQCDYKVATQGCSKDCKPEPGPSSFLFFIHFLGFKCLTYYQDPRGICQSIFQFQFATF